MKAYAAFSADRLEMIDLPVPQPDDYEVLVENEGCVFCNTTDRMIVDDLFATPAYPVVLGHENFGRVIQVGSKVRNFKLGDRVICANAIVKGFDGQYYSSWGGFAEYGIAGDLQAYLEDGHTTQGENSYRHRYHMNLVIPRELTTEQAALAFPLAETASSAMQVGDLTGRHVVVLGTGIAAYSLTFFCRTFGAASVTVLGRRESRLDVARQLGADRGFTDVDRLCDYMATLGGADVVFEASGNHAILEKGLPFLKEGGIFATYAVPHQPYQFDLLRCPKEFRYQRVDPKQKEAIGLVCDMLLQNKIPTHLLLTHTWAFEDLPQAFQQVRRGEVIKGLVTIHP